MNNNIALVFIVVWRLLIFYYFRMKGNNENLRLWQ